MLSSGGYKSIAHFESHVEFDEQFNQIYFWLITDILKQESRFNKLVLVLTIGIAIDRIRKSNYS